MQLNLDVKASLGPGRDIPNFCQVDEEWLSL